MRAVHIGVGHDDDALIAQIARGYFAPVPQPSACTRSLSSWFCCSLPAPRAGHVQDLAAQGQDRLGGAVARLLGAAAGAVAFHQEDFGAFRRVTRAVGQLAGQAQLAGGRLAR